jgi:16S rRNA G966 N2-methylase RsmD
MDIIKCKHKEYLQILEEYNKHHIIKRILCDEHQLLTFSYLNNIKEKEVYSPINASVTISLTKKNNIIKMNENILLRAVDLKSIDYFFYIQNLSYFSCKKNVIIVNDGPDTNDGPNTNKDAYALESILHGICECSINKDKKADAVYIPTLKEDGINKIDELVNKIDELVNKIDELVNKGGDLFITVPNNMDVDINIDIANNFEKMELIVNNIVINRLGMLKFSNYKGLNDTKGTNVMEKGVRDSYDNKIKQIKFEIKKLEEFKTYYLTRYIQYQIDTAKDLCKRYNVKFNKLCHINVDNYKLAKRFFNYDSITQNILKKIRFNGDSIYSVSSVALSEEISKIIKDEFPNVKTIIDGSANIGGNTINFAKHFDNVISNEYDSDTFSLLKNNVNAFNLKNVVCYNQNILTTDIIEKTLQKYDSEQVCIFLDPPWGGIYIKHLDVIDLYYGTTNVIDFISNILLTWVHKNVQLCMKVPPNFNFGKLYSIQTKKKHMLHIYKGDGCYILSLAI